MNDELNYPCRCGHSYVLHHIMEEEYGGWVWLDDIQEEVWQGEVQPHPVCEGCENSCAFEQMNALEFLEWKYDNKRDEKNSSL